MLALASSLSWGPAATAAAVLEIMPARGLAEHEALRCYCSLLLGRHYGVPAEMLWAVAAAEGGREGLVQANANRSYDIGVMQLNTVYLGEIAVSPAAVAGFDCRGFAVAARRLTGHLFRPRQGAVWRRLADYHSRTPEHNRRYARRLQQQARAYACPSRRSVRMVSEQAAE